MNNYILSICICLLLPSAVYAGDPIVNGDFSDGLTGWVYQDLTEQYPDGLTAFSNASVQNGMAIIHAKNAYGHGKISQSFPSTLVEQFSIDYELTGNCADLIITLHTNTGTIFIDTWNYGSFGGRLGIPRGLWIAEGANDASNSYGYWGSYYYNQGSFTILSDRRNISIFHSTGQLLSLNKSNFAISQIELEVVNHCYASKRENSYGYFDNVDITRFIINTHPTAFFTITPPFGDVLNTFYVDASYSADTEDPASDLQVRWDWENDGIWDTEYTADKTASHQYSTVGMKTIKLEVKDTGGLTATATKQVEVVQPNVPPVAVASVNPTTVFIGDPVSFSGSDSYDPDGEIVSYSWSFGDGETSTEVNPTHPYTSARTYTVTLTVEDDKGAEGSVTTEIIVLGKPDLAISAEDIQISSSEGMIGGTVYVRATVRNIGSADAGSFKVRLEYLSDSPLIGFLLDGFEEVVVSGLSQGSSTVIEGEFKSILGEYTVRVIVDPEEAV